MTRPIIPEPEVDAERPPAEYANAARRGTARSVWQH